MPNGMSERERNLREQATAHLATMDRLITGNPDGFANENQRCEFDDADRGLKNCAAQLKAMGVKPNKPTGSKAADAVFRPTDYRSDTDVPEVRGEPGEKLVKGQSFTEWVKRAAENGVQCQSEARAPAKVQYRDNEYLNDWFGARLGFRSESRALAEDTTGSGLAITPQAWTGMVVEYLYPLTVLGRLGVTQVPLPSEIYNMPVQTAPVQPAWLAENATIGLDANPAFAPLQFNAKGGFKDITTYSIELAQDAFVNGGLPDFLAQSCARNMALAIDAAGINGVAGNSGNPGLNAETGFVIRHFTSDAGTTGIAPADTKELSIIAEQTRNANAEPDGLLSNVKVRGTYARSSTATAFPMFWPIPDDVPDNWVTTANAAVVPATETDPATATSVALTGGTMSSIYAGPWSFMYLGMHLDLQTRPLVERYADIGQIGLLSFMRFSVRTANPQAFSRTIGILTT